MSSLQARADCITLEGFWQSEAYFRDNADTIRRELTLTGVPSPEFEHYQQLIGNTPMPVSIHIRRGDYVNHPEFSKTFGFVGLDYYKQALRQLNDRHENTRLYVFSDDQEWVHRKSAPARRYAFLCRIPGPTATWPTWC